jgi:hypothetical protein
MKIIANLGSLSVNLERINCIKVYDNILLVEYKKRFEYVLNPLSGEYERDEITDIVEMEYPDSGVAKSYKDNFDEMWEEYLLESTNDNK